MTASIVVRSCAAPKSRGGKFRRPVRILVVSGPVKGAYRSGDPDVIDAWENVDSRYTGPRSAYGQAMAAAEALLAEVNQNDLPTQQELFPESQLVTA